MITRVLLISLFFSFEFSSAQNYFSKFYDQNNTYLDIFPGKQDNFISVSHSDTILKTDSLFNIIWAKSFNPTAVLAAVGADNSIYLVNSDTSIVKADSTGNVIWSRKVSGSIMTQGGQSGNGLLGNLIGEVYSFDDVVLVSILQPNVGQSETYPSIVAFDTSGNYLWTISDSINTWNITGICKSASGGYWIAGVRDLATMTWDSDFLVKVSSSGNFLFSKSLCNPFTNSMVLLMSGLPDSTYMLVEKSYNYISTVVNYIHVSRINENGDSLWSYIYTLDTALFYFNGETPLSATSDKEGNVYILGNNDDIGSNYFILKIDTAGNASYFKSWTQSLQGLDIYLSRLYFQDNYILWSVRYNAVGMHVPVVFKMDTSGFNQCFGLDTSFQINRLPNLCAAGSGGILLQENFAPQLSVSTSSNITNGIFADFCSVLGDNEVNETIDLKISPNPFSSSIRLQFIGVGYTVSTLEIINMIGEKLIERKIGTEVQSLDLSALPDGCYFVSIKTDKNVFTEKILKCH